jgi:hypothetical protein
MPSIEFRALTRQILVRPRTWPLLLGAAWRFRRRDWYRHPPFLPLPSREYMQWRLHTAFGDEKATPTATDLVSYLEWTVRMRNHQQD